MTHDELIAKAVTRYSFRARGPFEGAGQYLEALIAHVQDRDLAEAHELRVGRPQAAWTSDDVRTFCIATSLDPGPREEIPDVEPAQWYTLSGFTPASETTLLKITDEALAVSQRMLRAKVRLGATGRDASIPIMINLLLDNGDLIVMQPQHRKDRLALVKKFARERPVFGFFVIYDGILHRIVSPDADVAAHYGAPTPSTPAAEPPPHASATKTDAIIAVIGTREMRLTKVRPYHVVGRRGLVFDEPREIDMRDPETLGRDAYASVFVSVPAATGIH